MLSDINFGTSGWYYKEWVGPFYDKEKGKFSFYTNYFSTVEINSTFYRYPTRGMVYGWFRSSPKDFKFSAKLPRVITHEKKLDSDAKVENDLIRFLELLNPLKASEKLGIILIQLPPSFTFEGRYDDLTKFLKILPKEYKFAVEFRHWSWIREETWDLLKKNNVAYTIVDEPLLPPDLHVTADFAYVRWHGKGDRLWYNYHYEKEELEPWIPKIKDITKDVKEVYGYFNNHFHGYAVENCIQILEMLGKATEEQIKIKEKIVRHNKEKLKSHQGRLEFYHKRLNKLDEMLLSLSNKKRLDRAREIEDSEIEIINLNEKYIEVKVKRYSIKIDLKNKTIEHDCRDWGKGLSKKRLCKHVVKIFLSMSSENSTNILRNLINEKKDWKFILPVSE
jgi:uncharacterized protein YecE (DUF72 family)